MVYSKRKTVNSLINSLYCLQLEINQNQNSNNLLDLMKQLKISSKKIKLKKNISKKNEIIKLGYRH